MYQIEQNAPSQSFKRAWQAAGRHLQQQGQGDITRIGADLNPPMAKHLSFRIGNQLIFVFVEAAEIEFHRNQCLFLKVAREATATPCIMAMTEHLSEFSPSVSGWGLIHAETGKEIDPLELVSDELIEMSDWELHDFAIQVVRDSLEKEDKKVFSVQSSLHIDPSIWFKESGKAYWVVVRAVRYPEKDARVPTNIQDIRASLSTMGKVGYFASVAVANADDPFDENENFLPLYRGHGMFASYKGLNEVPPPPTTSETPLDKEIAQFLKSL